MRLFDAGGQFACAASALAIGQHSFTAPCACSAETERPARRLTMSCAADAATPSIRSRSVARGDALRRPKPSARSCRMRHRGRLRGAGGFGLGSSDQRLRFGALLVFLHAPCLFLGVGGSPCSLGGGKVIGDLLVALVDGRHDLGHHAAADDEEDQAENTSSQKTWLA
jgi:hypothetical protein